MDLEIADGVAAGFVIAAAAQFGGHFGRGQQIAHRHGFGGGEDLGGVGEDARAQFLVDQARVLGIEESEGAESQNGEEGEPDDQNAAGRTQKEAGQAGIGGDADAHLPFRLFPGRGF